MPAIAGFILIATFLVTALSRRAHGRTALLIGTVPALPVALANPAQLGNPLAWFYIAGIWLPFLIAALTGAWLGKLVHAYWRRA